MKGQSTRIVNRAEQFDEAQKNHENTWKEFENCQKGEIQG